MSKKKKVNAHNTKGMKQEKKLTTRQELNNFRNTVAEEFKSQFERVNRVLNSVDATMYTLTEILEDQHIISAEKLKDETKRNVTNFTISDILRQYKLRMEEGKKDDTTVITPGQEIDKIADIILNLIEQLKIEREYLKLKSLRLNELFPEKEEEIIKALDAKIEKLLEEEGEKEEIIKKPKAKEFKPFTTENLFEKESNEDEKDKEQLDSPPDKVKFEKESEENLTDQAGLI